MEIRIESGLATLLGSPLNFEAEVGSIKEAIACLRANFRSWDRVITSLANRGIQFRIQVGNQDCTAEQIPCPISKKVVNLKISVVPCGSGVVGKVIAGVALIGLGLFSGGIGFLGMSGMTTALLGGALILGALFGQQKSPQDQERDGRKSNVFNRPRSTVREGGRLPVCYGEHLCGWTVAYTRMRSYFVS